ncbi:MAG TPA: isochorismate synthase [Castellaniella sp.]|nr:isochorismate synthase [Castellaniella sp.]
MMPPGQSGQPREPGRAATAGPAQTRWSDFAPGDCLFASPDEVLHGSGCLLSADPLDHIQACAADLLARAQAGAAQSGGPDASPPVLFGLLPYDSTRPARLLVPGRLRRMQAPAALPAPQAAGILRRREHPSGDEYEQGVRDALALLDADPALRKLVLARTLELQLDRGADLATILGRLWHGNPHGYTYAMPLAGAGEYFIGASPELLVRRRGRQVFIHPLAGTAARLPDAAGDAREAQALLDSPKDRLEHAVVVEAIETALRPLCRTLDIPARPSLTSTARLWHLGTPITGELKDPSHGVLDLAIALHPTPAVCGLPTADARRAIARIEPFERGFFAGAVGWCDASGDGVWSVAIRCAHVAGPRLTLSAGAGIVPGSVPAQERIETGNKLRTLLDALGLESTP